ncbi:hypothetical protein NPIL_355181 [Nephila pilipes]|uniref:Uncharacterized protein n=1 Tax=Nephila pilipes TaxID=299642 RepID=A0A8X6NBZ8_NEPPI|nr:hypothetical protein NPIL_355181 [Nephila pilipes]
MCANVAIFFPFHLDVSPSKNQQPHLGNCPTITFCISSLDTDYVVAHSSLFVREPALKEVSLISALSFPSSGSSDGCNTDATTVFDAQNGDQLAEKFHYFVTIVKRTLGAEFSKFKGSKMSLYSIRFKSGESAGTFMRTSLIMKV